jgi:hypothetical protein
MTVLVRKSVVRHTLAATLVDVGLNFLQKKDARSFQHITAIVGSRMQDLAYEAALKALQEVVASAFLIRVQICFIDILLSLCSSPAAEKFIGSGGAVRTYVRYICRVMQRCIIARRRLTQLRSRSRGWTTC